MENKRFWINSEIESENISTGVSRKVLAHSASLMSVEVTFSEGAVGGLHLHVHEQIAYIVSGKFEFTIEDEARVVTAGDTIYFAPNQLHGVKCIEAGIILDTFTPARMDFIS